MKGCCLIEPLWPTKGRYLWEDVESQKWSNSAQSPFHALLSVTISMKKHREKKFHWRIWNTHQPQVLHTGLPLCVGVEKDEEEIKSKDKWTHKGKIDEPFENYIEKLLLNISVMFMENFFTALKITSLGKFKHDYWRLNEIFQEAMKTV